MKKYFTFFILFFFFFSAAQPPQLLVQLGHSDRVMCLDYSLDGKFIISGGNDNLIKLWEVGSGLMVRTFQGHNGLIYDVKWGTDAKSFFSCSWDDRRLIKWDILSGKIIKEFRFGKEAATKIAESNDGKTLAAACDEEGVWLFKTSDLSLIKKFPVKEAGYVNFSEDEKNIIITQKGYGEVKTQIFAIASGNKLNELSILSGVESVALQGDRLLVCNYEKVAAYDLILKKEIFSFKKDSTRFRSVALSKNKKLGAVGMEYGQIKIFNENGNKVKVDGNILTLTRAHQYQINNMRFSPTGEFLCTASNDWTLKLFSTSTGNVVRNLKTQSEYIQGISLNTQGNLLAFSSGNMSTGNHAGVWDLMKGKLFSFYKGNDPDKPLPAVAFNPRGKNIAASGMDGSANYWEFPGNGNSGNVSFSNSPVSCIAYTPNGKNIISGTKDGKIVFWRFDRNKTELIEADKSGISSIAVSPDGTVIAAGTYDGKVLLYSYDTRQLLQTIESHTQATGYIDTSNVMSYGSKTSFSLDGNFTAIYASVMGIAFSPDGKTVAACGGNWIKLFVAASGKNLSKINQYGAGFVSVNFSHDGKMICSAGADFIVRLWDISSQKILQTLAGHQNEIRTAMFSNNDQYLISGSIDTQIKIWDIKKSKELLSYIILAGGDDYIISNPQGYYFATKGAAKILSFRIGNKVLPFEQFDLKFNRPDIILSDISLFAYGNALDNPNVPLIKSYYAAYQKRLKRLGFDEAQIGSELHIPEVSFLNKNIPLITKNPKLEFDIIAKDDKYNIKKINVWVNDVPVYGPAGLVVNAKEAIKKCEIMLSGERNKITVSALNDKGAESYKENFEIRYDGGVQNYKVYYIGIGVSNYKNSDFNLKYSVKDINDFSAAIKTRYPDADITLLTDENATRENILKTKEKLLKTTVNDKVIISLSGHGLLSKELDFYYATYDVDFKHPEKKGLLYDDLENLLEGIAARNKLLLVDACHSGEVDKENTLLADEIKSSAKDVNGIAARGVGEIIDTSSVGLSNSFELMQDIFADLSKGNGAVVISAAGGKEFALESPQWNNGVFTYSIIEGLKNKKADLNNSAKISVTELKKFVSDNVQLLTGGKQKPTSRRENLENDWDVW